MRISTKLYLLVASTVAVCLLLIIYMQRQTTSLAGQYDKLLAGAVTQQEEARVVQVEFKKQVQEWKDVLIRGYDTQLLEKHAAGLKEEEKKVAELTSRLETEIADPKTRAIAKSFLEAHRKLNEAYDSALGAFRRDHDPRRADAAVRGMDRPPTNLLDSLVGALKVRQQSAELIAKVRAAGRNAILISLGAFLVVGLFTFWQVRNRITGPLSEAVSAVDQMTRGDVRVSMALKRLAGRTDEIGRLTASVCALSENTTKQAEAAQRIAAGDLDVDVPVRSEEDVLGRSMTNVVVALRKLISEASRLTDAASAGNLAARGDLGALEGAYQQILAGVNRTLDAVIGPLHVAADYMRRISIGVLPPKITEAYQGDFDAVKSSLNTCLDSISALIEEMNQITARHDQGDIDVVISESRFQGAYREMAAGVNNMVNGHIVLNRKAMACVAELGRGNFAAPLEPFPGKKAFINQVVEDIRGNLTSFNKEISSLVEAAVGGRLSTRGNASPFAGGWKDLAAGVNRILDAVTEPIAEASQVIERIAAKDLTVRVKGNYRGDHAAVKTNINQMADYLAESMRKISESATTLSSAAEEFTAISQQMAGNAEETSAQAGIVQTASEEVTKNVAVAATGTAGMQSQIREISKSATESAKVVQHAVGAAETANRSISRLEESSVAIGNFVKVIASIASQTNLLALNASIEAARAGESGKGFSVVANEVKELAKGTATATADISRKIDAIQNDTREASVAIGEVAGIIKSIDEIARQLAASVEEQTLTTNDISRNVEHAARSTSEIARNIAGVAEAARDTSQGSNQSQAAAGELTRVAAQMQELVSAFRV